MHLTGVHLSVRLTGVHFMGVHLMRVPQGRAPHGRVQYLPAPVASNASLKPDLIPRPYSLEIPRWCTMLWHDSYIRPISCLGFKRLALTQNRSWNFSHGSNANFRMKAVINPFSDGQLTENTCFY